MFDHLNDWHDYWRLFNAVVCAISVFLLFRQWRRDEARKSYTTMQKDFWYALMIWTFTGLISSIEGILQDSPVGVRVAFVSAGALVTLKAMRSFLKSPNAA